MHARGGRDFDTQNPQVRPGEVMVIPYANTDVVFYSREFMDPIGEFELPACRWLATMQGQVGAGFYSGFWGPMPFVFGLTSPDKYEIVRLKLGRRPTTRSKGNNR